MAKRISCANPEQRRACVVKIAYLRVRNTTWEDVATALTFPCGESARHFAHQAHDLWNEEYGAALRAFTAEDVTSLSIAFDQRLVEAGINLLNKCNEESRELTESEHRVLGEAQKASHSLKSFAAKLQGQLINLNVNVKRETARANERLIEHIGDTITRFADAGGGAPSLVAPSDDHDGDGDTGSEVVDAEFEVASTDSSRSAGQ